MGAQVRARPVARRMPPPTVGEALAAAVAAAKEASRDDLVQQCLDGIFEILGDALRTSRYGGHDPRTFQGEISRGVAADASLRIVAEGHSE